jgi:hypothetical protein
MEWTKEITTESCLDCKKANNKWEVAFVTDITTFGTEIKVQWTDGK